MNAGVLFQMLGGNTSVQQANTQSRNSGIAKGNTSNSNDNRKESFRNEMDKLFERQDNAINAKKFNKADKTDKPVKDNALDKVQGKKEDKNYPDRDDGETKVDDELTAEEQALAATQLQQNQTNTVPEGIKAGMEQVKGAAIMGMLMENAAEQQEECMTNVLEETVVEAEGEIKLPFQNNADLVKSAMLKAAADAQNQGEAKPESGESMMQSSDMMQENQETEVQAPIVEEVVEGLATETDVVAEHLDTVHSNLLAKNNLDLSKVNIKVANAPVDTTKPDMAKQMADKILYKLSQGKQEFDLELNPKNLGKINIKMIFENGSAQLIMSSSNPKTHQLLSMHSDTLRGILENAIGLESTINLKQQEANESQFDRDNFQEENRGQQQQKQQEEREQTHDISFMDRLRLGLVDDLEVAV